MNLVRQTSVNTVVTRKAPEYLHVCSTMLGTDDDAAALLKVETTTFRILDASWEVCRSPGSRWNGSASLTEIFGIEAYLHSGPAIRRAMSADLNPVALSLVQECIKGLVQAETFVYQERGRGTTTREYDHFFADIYLGACRYYSNLDRVRKSWFDHVGNADRDFVLFTRGKQAALFTTGCGTECLTGTFTDSFHEMALTVFLKDGIVTALSGGLKKAPDAVCFENSSHLDRLLGADLCRLDRKTLAGMVGGGSGCSHLLDLALLAVDVAAGGK